MSDSEETASAATTAPRPWRSRRIESPANQRPLYTNEYPADDPPAPRWMEALCRIVHGSARLHAALARRSYGDLAAVAWREPTILRVKLGWGSLEVLRFASVDRPTAQPPALLLHGVNACAWSWARTASLLSDEYTVLAPSLPGHGGSDIPATGYSLAHTSRDLDEALDALGVETVMLAGESWGGKVALHFAATRPDRVRRLALCDPAPPWGFNPLLRRLPGLADAAMLPERRSYADDAAFAAQARRTVYLPLHDHFDELAWRGRFARKADGSFAPCLPRSCYDEIMRDALLADITPLLEGFATPALFLKPRMSITFWPGEMARMRRTIPHLKVRPIEGGHTFVSENPLTAARELREFFSAGA